MKERSVVLLVAAVQFVNILDFMMVMPLGPDFADSLGIPTSHIGYLGGAYTLSAAVAGLAGALFAMAQQSAYPNVMSLHNSGFVVMMVLIGGGLVSFWGPVIGATFFILARDLLGAYTETWLLWYGLIFMAMVLFKPEGIAGAWQAWKARPKRSAPAGKAAAPVAGGAL